MIKRIFPLLVIVGSVLGLAEAKRPNIVFILADDLGIRDLSNEGSTFYESPHIDQIAAMGTKFTHGYAACQVCSPSRASIMTGKYPTNHGITTWIGEPSGEGWRQRKRDDILLPAEYEHNLRASEITLAEVLRDAGYTTFFAGKWHLGSKGSWPTDHGFEINKGGWDSGSPAGGYFAPWKNPNLPSGPDGESLTLRLAKETASFIDAQADSDKPFFAFLSFYAVHGPIQCTQPKWQKYREKAINAGLADKRFIFDRRLGVRQVQDCPVYAGLIESMDDAVGLVLETLEKHDLLKNTIVCFTSDNGGVSSGDNFSTSNLPYRGGKGRQWEGGIREPFYIYAPGVTKPGSQSDAPVSGIDWYPTLLELAGVDLPAEQNVDGVSLARALRGGELEPRPLFWHYPHYGNQGGEPSSIILKGDWKLIFYHEDGRYELYNIAEDIGEQKDLISAEPQKAAALKARLQRWLKATDAKMPTLDPQFDPTKHAARLEQLKTKGLERLEREHAKYLEEDYQPNKDWWGSATKD